MATQTKGQYTVSVLDLLPKDGNRYEVIEGELYASCSPSGTKSDCAEVFGGLPIFRRNEEAQFAHQRLTENLSASIKTYLDASPIGEVRTTARVIFSEVSAVICDLVFVTRERLANVASADIVVGAPELVVEFVSLDGESQRSDKPEQRGRSPRQRYAWDGRNTPLRIIVDLVFGLWRDRSFLPSTV